MSIHFMFEAADFQKNQTSVLHLDEYLIIRSTVGVSIKRGVQCSFGALSSKPTSWLYFMVNTDDIPDVRKHPPVNWYSDMTHTQSLSPVIHSRQTKPRTAALPARLSS